MLQQVSNIMVEVVIDLLGKATSQNPDLFKLAEEHLKRLETESGYYPILMAIILDRSIDVSIRWLASVCLKNGIDRYWRKTAPNAMSNEDRNLLRHKFLLCFDEPVNQVAAQIAVIIAKVSRLDWPLEWPELFPTMLSAVQRPEELFQQRGLLILYHVVKTLASKRLAGDQQVFQQMTMSFFPIAVHLWDSYSSAFIQCTKNGETNCKLKLQNSIFCLKVLRKLVIHGFKKPADEPAAVNFVRMIFQHFKPFVESRKFFFNDDDIREICEKYLVLLVKVLDELLEQHPPSFVQFIRCTLECSVVFCFSEEYKDCLFERFTVGLLNLIKSILICQDYKYIWKGHKKAEKDPELLDVPEIRKEFFTPEILNEMVQQLVYRYFLLTEEEICSWNENPEEYAAEKFGETWKFNLRPCTETLFLVLFRAYDEALKPLVLSMMESLHTMKSTDFNTIIKKEAILNAVGLATFDLYHEISFDKWLTDIMIPELQITDSNYYIVRRRVIWAIGQWVEVKFPKSTVPLMYQIIVQSLDESENLVVRVTAANSLKCSIDLFEFNEDDFEPFLQKSLGSLFNLLKQVQQCDLKMSVLHVMTFIIERVPKVKGYVGDLVNYLKYLWETCMEHIMLCCAIIDCLGEIVCTIGKESERLQELLLPMVVYSTDINQPAHVYLMEAGLTLWNRILHNTSVCTPDLLGIAQNILPLLESGKENFDRGTDLIEAYILLSPKDYLERYGESIVKTYSYVHSDLPVGCDGNILKSIEIALIIFPVESPVLFKPILMEALSAVLENNLPPYDLSIRLTLLSRIILHNQNCFASILEAKAQETGQQMNTVFQQLLSIWLKIMPVIDISSKKKLSGLAFLRLLTTDCSVVYENICGILLAIVEALNDITRSIKDPDILYISETTLQENDENDSAPVDVTENEKRKSQNDLLDPVYNVNMKDYLKSQMNAFKLSVGETKFDELMSTVDIETMQMLQKFLQS